MWSLSYFFGFKNSCGNDYNSSCNILSVEINNGAAAKIPFHPFSMSDRYGVSLHIQSKCRKIRTRKTSNTDTFYAVTKFNIELRRRGVRDIIKVSHEIISTLVLCFADKNRVLHENWKLHVCLFCLFFIWSRFITDREKAREHPL